MPGGWILRDNEDGVGVGAAWWCIWLEGVCVAWVWLTALLAPGDAELKRGVTAVMER